MYLNRLESCLIPIYISNIFFQNIIFYLIAVPTFIKISSPIKDIQMNFFSIMHKATYISSGLNTSDNWENWADMNIFKLLFHIITSFPQSVLIPDILAA